MKYDKTHEKELKDKIIEASIQEQIQMIVEKHVVHMMWIYIIKFPLLNHSKKHQFVTDFTSFVVIDEPSEPQTPKADKKPEQKPDEKTSEEKEHEIEDKKDSVEKKFMKDLNNQFSKKKSQPITATPKPATQKPVDLKQKTQKAVPKTPTAKKIIAPSKKSNTGAVFGDPHFMIFDKNEVPFCFNYQPKALSSMITLVRDPKSKLEIKATVTGNGSNDQNTSPGVQQWTRTSLGPGPD